MAESFQQSDQQEDDDPSPAPADAQTGQADDALMAMLAGNDIDRILAEQEAALSGDVPSVDESAIPEPIGTLATANENATLQAGREMESSADPSADIGMAIEEDEPLAYDKPQAAAPADASMVIEEDEPLACDEPQAPAPAGIDMVIEEDEPLACDEGEKDLQAGDDLLQRVSAMADAESQRDAEFAASVAHAAALDRAQPNELEASDDLTLSDVEMRALHMQIETGGQPQAGEAEAQPEPQAEEEPPAEAVAPAAEPSPAGEEDQEKHRPADDDDDVPVMTLQELDDLLAKQAGGKPGPKPLAPLEAPAPTPAPKVPAEELAAAIQRQAPAPKAPEPAEAANLPANATPAAEAPAAETDNDAVPAQPSRVLASVCRTLEVMNLPFAWLPLRARKVMGLIGAQLLLAGIAMLLFCMLRR